MSKVQGQSDFIKSINHLLEASKNYALVAPLYDDDTIRRLHLRGIYIENGFDINPN